MTTELWILLFGAALGLVHILAAAAVWTQEVGLAYNASARDEQKTVQSKLAGRLDRARGNFLETFPIFAAAVLIAHVSGQTGGAAALGAWIWLIARIVYLPLYAFGVPWLRSLVWAAALAGLALVWLAATGVLA